jgi:ribosomal protein S18 acetylase RimI-like enzyme
MQVRPYAPADGEFISSLAPRFSEFDLPEWRSREEIDHTSRATLQKALEEPEADSAIFIAEDETGEPAGFIHLQTRTDYFNGEKQGYISDLAVARSFEGKGAGRILLQTAETWARQKGYGLLSLYVFAGNSHAQRIYEKQGFNQELVKYVKVIGRDP